MNSKELQQQWDDVCAHIKSLDNIDPAQINAIFSRLRPQAMSPGFLMLTTDNDFIKTWIECHYLEIIKSSLQALYGVPFSVLIEIEKTDDSEEEASFTTGVNTQEHQEKKAPSQSKKENQQGNKSESSNQTSVQTDSDDLTGNQMASYTFENFVIGDSNRMAYSTAVAVAETPGKSHLNPLFIYGKSGLGKTHLLCAIKHYINENLPHLTCVYVDSHDFLNEYTDSVIQHDKEKT
ncbi:MAG: DnaA/Hda family protein, partial [Eggerthellaceae bacterium]|nr:DnaA/Hda family protein [Eggerthellaceae bacterium]